MKKIMFVFALVAILFASCANPIMPVDNTDDIVITGSPWTNVTLHNITITFEDNGNFNLHNEGGALEGRDLDDPGTYTAIDGVLILNYTSGYEHTGTYSADVINTNGHEYRQYR